MNTRKRFVFIVSMAAIQVLADSLLAFGSWDWSQAKAHLSKTDQRPEAAAPASGEALKDAPRAAPPKSAAKPRRRKSSRRR